jgi:hypothetical protein
VVAVDSFFPFCLQTSMLEEGIGNHRHEGVAVQPVPGSPFEVVEPEFLLQLLMSLLADPAGLDGGGEVAQSQRRRQAGEVVFRLSRGAVFTDEPRFVAGRCCCLHDSVWLTVDFGAPQQRLLSHLFEGGRAGPGDNRS